MNPCLDSTSGHAGWSRIRGLGARGCREWGRGRVSGHSPWTRGCGPKCVQTQEIPAGSAQMELLTRASDSPVSQGPAEWREGEAQAAGTARHGAAP